MVTIKAKERKGIIKNAIGLLGKDNPGSILLHTRFGIHTFGMKYPIDVLVLDNMFTVKKVKKELVPNRIFLWNPRYVHVLELPSGTITDKKIYIGTSMKLILQ